jgi:hypothetical protein
MSRTVFIPSVIEGGQVTSILNFHGKYLVPFAVASEDAFLLTLRDSPVGKADAFPTVQDVHDTGFHFRLVKSSSTLQQKTIAAAPNRGENTHHHDQSMTPVNLSVRKIRNTQ